MTRTLKRMVVPDKLNTVWMFMVARSTAPSRAQNLRGISSYIGLFSVDHPPTRKQFLRNLETKMQDNEFLGDTQGLLRPTATYDAHEAFNLIKDDFL